MSTAASFPLTHAESRSPQFHNGGIFSKFSFSYENEEAAACCVLSLLTRLFLIAREQRRNERLRDHMGHPERTGNGPEPQRERKSARRGPTDALAGQWRLHKRRQVRRVMSAETVAQPLGVAIHFHCGNLIQLCFCFFQHSCHPWLPVVATASGQRHVTRPTCDANSSTDSESDDSATIRDNSVKLWWAGQ